VRVFTPDILCLFAIVYVEEFQREHLGRNLVGVSFVAFLASNWHRSSAGVVSKLKVSVTDSVKKVSASGR
jgi:hypothetical protein